MLYFEELKREDNTDIEPKDIFKKGEGCEEDNNPHG